MRSRVFAVMVVVIGVAGCSDRAVGMDDTGEVGADAGDDGEDGQAPAWVDDESCLMPHDDPGRCPSANGGGWTTSQSGDWCGSCSCAPPCNKDSDCGFDGARCDEGVCGIDCSDGQPCPGDRVCVPVRFGMECAFVTDDAFSCGNPCPDIQDKATCNGTSSPEFGRCQWAVEQIYTDDSCEPAAPEQGRCVLLRPGNECGKEACGPDGPRVYYSDYGAGTYGLWTLDGCDGIPENLGGSKRCDFSGGYGLPVLCDCACG